MYLNNNNNYQYVTKEQENVSTPKKVLFIGLGILALGIVVFTIGLQQSPAFWKTFQCGYDLGLNNSSLTRGQISEYYNNQILKTENLEEDDLTIVGFGIILIVVGLIITSKDIQSIIDDYKIEARLSIYSKPKIQ
jgi:hypothetical protein